MTETQDGPSSNLQQNEEHLAIFQQVESISSSKLLQKIDDSLELAVENEQALKLILQKLVTLKVNNIQSAQAKGYIILINRLQLKEDNLKRILTDDQNKLKEKEYAKIQNKLQQISTQLINKVWASQRKDIAYIHKTLERSFLQKLDILSIYIEDIKSGECMGLIYIFSKIMLTHKRLSSYPQGAKHKNRSYKIYDVIKESQRLSISNVIMTKYVELNFQIRQPAKEDIYSAFIPFIQSLSIKDFEEQIFPIIKKTLKRSIEPILPSLQILLENTKFDVDPLAYDFLNMLMEGCRHSNESVRLQSLECIDNLINNIKAPEVLFKFSLMVLQLLLGKSQDKVKQTDEKIILLQALKLSGQKVGQLISQNESQNLNQGCDDIIQGLIQMYKLEGNQECKQALSQNICCWIELGDGLLSDELIQLSLNKGMQEKADLLRKSFYQLIYQAVRRSPKNVEQAKSLIPQLQKVVQDSRVKAAIRPEAIYALNALSCIYQQDNSIQESTEFFQKIPVDFPLFQDELVLSKSNMQENDMESLGQLIISLMLNHLPKFSGSDDICNQVGRQFMLILIISNKITQKNLQRLLQNEIISNKNCQFELRYLSQNLVKIMSQLSSQVLFQNIQDGDIGYIDISARFQLPVRALVPKLFKGQLKPQDISSDIEKQAYYRKLDCEFVQYLLMALNHPIITRTYKDSTYFWKQIILNSKELMFFVKENAEQISKQYFDEVERNNNGLIMQHDTQLSVLKAFGCIFAFASTQGQSQMIDNLEIILQRNDHDLLSQHQIQTFENVRISNGFNIIQSNLKNGVAQKTLESQQPAQKKGVAQKQSASKSSKPKQVSKDKGSEAQQKLKEDEQAIFLNVLAVEQKLLQGLEMVGSMALASPHIVQNNLHRLAQIILPLLTSPLVGDLKAADCAMLLCKCMSPKLAKMSDMILPSLNYCVNLSQKGQLENPEKNQTLMKYYIRSVLNVTHQVALKEKQRLKGSTYTFLFPIFEAVLLYPVQTQAQGRRDQASRGQFGAQSKYQIEKNLQEQALQIVAKHVDKGQELPREAISRLLYKYLDNTQQNSDMVLESLCNLFIGFENHQLRSAFVGLESGSEMVRNVALKALQFIPFVAQGQEEVEEHGHILTQLYLVLFDPHQANVELAQQIWEDNDYQLPADYYTYLLTIVDEANQEVQIMAARGLAMGIQIHPNSIEKILEILFRVYDSQDTKQQQKEFDPFDLNPDQSKISSDQLQNEFQKVGVALVVGEISQHLNDKQLYRILDFLLNKGFTDESQHVSEAMVQAAMRLIHVHADKQASSLLKVFEEALRDVEQKPITNQPQPIGGKNIKQVQPQDDHQKKDYQRAQIVRVLGTLASHLDPYNQKVQEIIELLVRMLQTPSEVVQNTIATCLQDVVKAISSKPEVSAHYASFKQKLTKDLIQTTMYGKDYATRRGAAYGLGGVARGLGLKALREYGVLETLKQQCLKVDSTPPEVREGCMMAFECLIRKLQRLFEPYIVNLLPVLINQFGDKDVGVRNAAEETGKVIMANLTQQGVGMVLPALLKGVNSSQGWRTMVFSITLLGAMSNCAPQQLSNCLPQIVPVLQRVLNDPHPKVQEAATNALNEIGSIISDPAMQNLVPYLVRALTSPEKSMGDAMTKLTETSFTTNIDAPSLALVMPILSRGIRDRHTDVKKKAGKAIGNLSLLIQDVQDLSHYLPQLLPGLENALIDPNLEVRSIASRALANLLRELGEEKFGDLFQRLMGQLVSEKSSIERTGSAQALAEIFAVMEENKLDQAFPNIIINCSSKSWYVREGHLTLFQFLPYTCEEALQLHLQETMVVILQGLADDAEGVRQSAYISGETLVNIYGEISLSILLPEIERGILSDKWRTRQGAIQYVGKLLFQIAGISGKLDGQDLDEDEQVNQHNHLQKITSTIGLEKRNKVLSEIYIARSDTNADVKQNSVNIWKAIITNTPKTLLEILPELIKQIVEQLASRSQDGKTMASRCLGELVQKMGNRIMDRIMPVLKREIYSVNTSMRQGVCRGLREILLNMSKHDIPNYIGDFITPLQQALVDQDASVKDAAEGAFSILFRNTNFGSKDDQILPVMLANLDNPKEYSKSLQGLKVVINVKPQIYRLVVPKLMKKPYKLKHISALASLQENAGLAMQPHIVQILYGLLPELSKGTQEGLDGPQENGMENGIEALSESQPQTLQQACRICLENMAIHLPSECLTSYVIELLQAFDKEHTKYGACQHLTFFCLNTKLDISAHIGRMILTVGELYADDAPQDIEAAVKALSAIVKSIPKQDMGLYIKQVNDAMSSARDKQRRKQQNRREQQQVILPAFNYPQFKPLEPVLTVYLQTLLLGSSADQKEISADAIGTIVEVATPEALKAHVIQIAGPLIRVLGDRYPWPVKNAILGALGILLVKVPSFLKPFVAQLQTSFMRCLNDVHPSLRNSAAKNLGLLSSMSPRVDFLAQDLIQSAAKADEELKLGYLKALYGLLQKSGQRLKPETIQSIGPQLSSLLLQDYQTANLYVSISLNVGSYSKLCSSEDFNTLIQDDVLNILEEPEWLKKYAKGQAMLQILNMAFSRVEEHGFHSNISQIILSLSDEQKIPLRKLSIQSVCPVLVYEGSQKGEVQSLATFIKIFTTHLGPDGSADVQIDTMTCIRKICYRLQGQPVFEKYNKELIPLVCQIIQGTTVAQIRILCENVVCLLLNIGEGDQSRNEAHKKVRQMQAPVPQLLTESYLRRIIKQQVEDAQQQDTDEEELFNTADLLS